MRLLGLWRGDMRLASLEPLHPALKVWLRPQNMRLSRSRRGVWQTGLRFGHVDHVDQAVHMDIWGRLENGPHMVHMVHIPLF